MQLGRGWRHRLTHPNLNQSEIVATSIRSPLLLSIVTLSVAAAIASTVQLIRERSRGYRLTLATGERVESISLWPSIRPGSCETCPQG
ncbi:MAG: hypothetical protein QNJ46_29070 [Leptolyngbyaceae cyanobacterium MO_188.B28]|nr:hypothetical protein [Leptolyngbyaceae cyanobacterium MO_188.B28]